MGDRVKIRRDKLDTLFSEFIRRRAVARIGGCEYCGKGKRWQDMDCSHFHGRRKLSTRYDPDNCAGLCRPCHFFLGEHPNKHADWFEKRLGSDRYEQLNIRAETICKNLDREKLTLDIKKMIEEIA